jgi:hypothetical protein
MPFELVSRQVVAEQSKVSITAPAAAGGRGGRGGGAGGTGDDDSGADAASGDAVLGACNQVGRTPRSAADPLVGLLGLW